jgi:hypothetical protein
VAAAGSNQTARVRTTATAFTFNPSTSALGVGGTVTAPTFSGALSGNATTATTLQTARTFTIGATGKTFNGSANVTWTLAEIGAYAASNPSGFTSNTGTVTGSGASGRVPIWSSASNITNSANFTYNTTSNRMGVGITTPTLDSSGATIHIHAPTNQWSMLHTTNGNTGTGATQGTIYGMVGLDAYIYNYSAGGIFFGVTSDERMRLNASGALGLGLIPTTNTAGRFEASNDIVAFVSSDKRWKTNIKNIDRPLEKVNELNGVSFDWIEDEPVHGNKGHDIGVIAQEVEELFPEMVQTRASGMKAVKYEKLIPVLIEAIKELSNKVKILEEK